ncbi:MAG: 2-C-methyl-D-erythritol 4-phosphate cytidylyltransferase [Chlamydiales bacterium]
MSRMPPDTSTDAYASAVLLAAGSSTRMGLGRAGERKPFLKLAGRTLIEHAIATFAAAASVHQIVLVGHADDLEAIQAVLEAAGQIDARCIAGGAQRTDSVRLGFAETSAQNEVVLVHDVARPLVRPDQVDAVAACAREHGGALLAMPVRDTIKMCADGRSVSTLDRSRLWAAQTPQAFQRERFARVLDEALLMSQGATDDAALYERYAGPVTLVESSSENLKVTVPGDLALAEALLGLREVSS